MSGPIINRIRKHGLFDGEDLISHKEVVRRINTIRRKKLGFANNYTLHGWMKQLGFTKRWIGGNPGASNARLFWQREG